MCLARLGYLECLQYVIENGAEWHEETTLVATKAGHFDILQYAIEHGAAWHDETTYVAAYSRRLEVLKYAVELHKPWHRDTLSIFMDVDNERSLECLRYFIATGEPWDKHHICVVSQLECLVYAHEHGAPWFPESTSYAAYRGKLECVKYAIRHGASWPPYGSSYFSWRPNCLQYAYRQGGLAHISKHSLISDYCSIWEARTRRRVEALPIPPQWFEMIRHYSLWDGELPN